MTAESVPTISFEDYVEGELVSERRHEWVAGRDYVMAGGSERHDLMAGLVYEALAPYARARGCRPFTQNRKVRLGEHAYIPDVLVVCRSAHAPHKQYERDLTVVVEVLSPGTESIDRREKTPVYAGAPSFEAYLIVDPDRRRIEVATRSQLGVQWEVFGSGDVVLPFGLDVDQLYDTLDATALT